MNRWEKVELFRKRAAAATNKARRFRRSWKIIARDWLLVAEKQAKLADEDDRVGLRTDLVPRD
jgi:hypothetical protein